MKKVLFVTYGGGHVKMVIPVASALVHAGLAEPTVLALTTAAPVVRQSGLNMVQFKTFVTPHDSAALQQGRRLMDNMRGSVADQDETAAYLGLSYSNLVATVGESEAAAAYKAMGRQAFLPVLTLERILTICTPDLVVITNSPRAERAAAIAARKLGIPVICMVDLFALDEVRWIGAPDYADHVCVLNDSVKQFLINAGRHAGQITVTGNPGFDALFDPGMPRQGSALRERMSWQGKHVILWPSVIEPDVHPFSGCPGHPALPAKVLNALITWVQCSDGCVLCIRPRPGERVIAGVIIPDDHRVVMTGQDWVLAPLLHAVDLVVTINSTVGLEGRLAGARVVQVSGSVLDDALPLQAYGMADETVPLTGIQDALERQILLGRHLPAGPSLATDKVVNVITSYL